MADSGHASIAKLLLSALVPLKPSQNMATTSTYHLARARAKEDEATNSDPGDTRTYAFEKSCRAPPKLT